MCKWATIGSEFSETNIFERLGNHVFRRSRSKCSAVRSPNATRHPRLWSALDFLSAGMKFAAQNTNNRLNIMTYGGTKFSIFGRFETQFKTTFAHQHEKLRLLREILALQPLGSKFFRYLVKVALSRFCCERRCLGRLSRILVLLDWLRWPDLVHKVRLTSYDLIFCVK